jgi:hypothetical protein
LPALLAGGVVPARRFTLKSNDIGGQATNKQMGNIPGWLMYAQDKN